MGCFFAKRHPNHPSRECPCNLSSRQCTIDVGNGSCPGRHLCSRQVIQSGKYFITQMMWVCWLTHKCPPNMQNHSIIKYRNHLTITLRPLTDTHKLLHFEVTPDFQHIFLTCKSASMFFIRDPSLRLRIPNPTTNLPAIPSILFIRMN